MEQKIITRAEAKAQGLKRYFTGKPCKHGHVAERLTSNMGCYECSQLRSSDWRSINPYYGREYTKAWRGKNPVYAREYYLSNREKMLANNRRWREENAEHHRDLIKSWMRENAARVREKQVKWRGENPAKCAEYNKRWNCKNEARVRNNQRIWRGAHPEKLRAYSSRRRADELRATPKWAEGQDIEQIFVLAIRLSALTGVPYDVDHVIPLRSKHVCGLHVAENLIPVPAKYNRTKSNKFKPGRSHFEIDQDELWRLAMWEAEHAEVR